ncbi:MAG: hypothetical protein ACXACY_30885, partial [Candidatus Hodarchaeales archaeon]
MNFLSNLVFFFSVLFITTAVGYPTQKIMKLESSISKIFLSFAMGFGIISVSGVISEVFLGSAVSLQYLFAGVFLLLSLSTLRSSNDWLINSKKLI